MAESNLKLEKKKSVSMAIANFSVRGIFDIVLYALVVMLLIYLCRQAYDFCYQVFGKVSVSEAQNAKVIIVSIEDYEKPMEVAEKLEKEGLIINKYSFEVRRVLENRQLRSGSFSLDTAMDYGEILDVIGEKN